MNLQTHLKIILVMKQSFIVLAFGALLLSVGASAQIVVQVGAFNEKVPLTNFMELDGIYHVVDRNAIHRYLIGGFGSGAEAAVVAEKARSLGFPNARVEDMSKYPDCTCFVPDKVKTLKSIFFDFDKSSLRSESIFQLDKLYEILVENPSYTAELRAHTDAKGSVEYNNALSQRRATAAKDYLLRKGIPSHRIKTSTFGENDPIAKNEVNGQDTEEGRQYNRRVELRVIDAGGNVLNSIVEEIQVPTGLETH
jgi:outer membrane protein OmpA-like peptidoglycan-associated protein